MSAKPDSWEQLLRKMLPEGAPLPDEEQLDYSISVDYEGHSPFSKPPIFNPITTSKKFTTYPKQAPSFTPNRWKSSFSSDATNTHNKMVSVYSSVIDKTYEIIKAEDSDCDKFSRFDGGKLEAKKPVEDVNMGRVCRRCLKGSVGFLQKNVGCMCIVCGASYCRKCVLKAMGSMPEGRKCVGCIGKSIDESNRGKLGKSSRILAKLCSGLEIERIMMRERDCKVNQVRADQVILNGRQLVEEELDRLLGCVNPPKGLSPGRYWYDKESGLWGKEGHKPDRIISSRLHVGAKLQIDASNGSTSIYMNGREITKVELKVLKLAKVQCPRDTHFWLYEDGSYEEEGQNSIKGCIWEKASVRFLSSLFSLPVPPECTTQLETKEKPAFSSATSMVQQKVHKLLLVGLEGSGTSTIFKQVKLEYANKFTPEELQNIKLIIQSNMFKYLGILLEGRERFEEDALMNKEHFNQNKPCIYSVGQKIKQFSDWFLDLVANGDIDTYFPAAAREYAPLINDVWKDPSIQETYNRGEELQLLPDIAKYFLDRVSEISSNEYEPSEKDILLAEDITPSNGFACIEFSFDDHSALSQIYDESEQLLPKYELVQLSSKGLHEGRKWLELFEGMNVVILCISLCDYDQIWTDHSGFQRNKMLASRDFLKTVARKSCFENSAFVLLLNNYDQFEDKIKRVPLTTCEWFGDFNPVNIHHHSKNRSQLARQAYYYIAVKFKELYASITGRKLYVSQIRDRDRMSVDEAFRYIQEILKWEEIKDEEVYDMSDED